LIVAACRGCSTELDDIRCPRCSPCVDAIAFDEIERGTSWRRARSHRPTSRLTKFALIGAGVFGVFALLVRGETEGLWVFGPLTALAVLVAIYVQTRPLKRLAGVVLARAYSTSGNSKGQTSTQDYLHVQARVGALSFVADEHKIGGLEPGDAVIAFARGSQLDDVWPAPIATAPITIAPIAAATTVGHVSTPLAPPSAPIVPATVERTRAADIENAQQVRVRIDHADAARVREAAITRPWRLYLGPLIVACVGIGMFLCIPLAGALDEKPDVEGEAARLRVIYIVGACILGVFFLWAGLLARSIRTRPIVRTLCVAYGERVTSDGKTSRRQIALLDEHQRLEELPVLDKALKVPIGEPLIVFVHDRRILAVIPVAITGNEE
jgi:hypothetical protein